MDITKIIKGVINPTKYTVTAPIIKEDYGLYLKIEGIDLPAVYEVDFSNSENSGSSVTMVGNSDGVLIPRQFIKSGQDVFAFLYWTGEDFGRTVYKFRIPNKLRPDRTEEQPTPEEQSLIDQAISALNSAVEQTAEDVETTTAKAAEATSAAATATQKASESAESAQSAGTYATRAETALHGAETARTASQQSATASATSAEQAAGSALTASTKAGDASASATAAAQSASSAGQSALDARDYKDAANLSAESASEYAGSASDSATTATEQATIATNKAEESAQSALDATTAKEDAVTAKTAAETAQTAAETAQGLAEDAQTGAETAQAAAEAAVYAKADGIVDTASGAVASFPDGADDFPMKSIKVAIDPVQDLHGQESPYPAGGGKNLIDYLSCVGMGSRDGTDSIYSDNTSISGTELTINQAFGNNGGILKGVGTFPLSTGEYVTISGKATLAGTSKLVVGISNYDGGGTNNINSNVTVTNGRFSVKLDAKSDYAKTGIFLQPQTSNSTAVVSDVMVALGQTELPYAPYSNICPISGWTGAQVVVSPTTDAQDGTTYPVSWETEAGTVYGGTLDVVSGELVVDMASVDLGTLTWSWNASNGWIASFAGIKPMTNNNFAMDAICSTMPVVSKTESARIVADGTNVDTIAATWHGTYLYGSNANTSPTGMLCYALATPITYQLTPTEVRTLLGQNNVWADTGDSTVKYYADTKRYIDKRIAELVN